MTAAYNIFDWLPCSVVFISTSHENKRDIMTATAMFVSEKEPLIIVSVAKNHLTEQLIDQSGKFAVAIAAEGQEQLARQLGSTKGDRVDKIDKFSIKSSEKTPADIPIPEGSAAWLSCEVEDSYDIEGYRIFLGRVKDHKDMDAPPLVWLRNKFHGLKML